jgi:ribosomal protein S12 methylthiotransferase
MRPRYWLETLGCPKNQVDSDKLAGLLQAQGYEVAPAPEKADLVVVNTCAFIEAAREESVETVLALAGARKDGARLVVTGCMAERYGQELADALPEVDRVAGFGVPVTFGRLGSGPVPHRRPARDDEVAAYLPSFDLLNLPRPRSGAPWAYVKVAEGCDRRCGFCAIPSFRGPQRSRAMAAVLEEIDGLEVEEVVLVAQDLVSWNRDVGRRGPLSPPPGRLVDLVRAVSQRVRRVRLLYLYPSGLDDELIEVVGSSGCPYFDLSLQHVSAPLLRRMRRPGSTEAFLDKISVVRRRFPDAALRSSFIIGYPGETEEDHDALLAFLAQAELDWVGFFSFSNEQGTYAAGLDGQVPPSLVAERIRECSEVQDPITARRREALVGERCLALVDAPGAARTHREAPEIDGTVLVPESIPAGTWTELFITAALGPDLVGAPVAG